MGQKQWEEYFRGLEKSVFRKFVDSIFFRSLKIFDENIFVEKFSQPKKIEKSRKIENVEKSKKVENSRKKIELFKNRFFLFLRPKK